MAKNNFLESNQFAVLTASQIQEIVNEAVEKAVEKYKSENDLKKEVKKAETKFLTRKEASKMFYVNETTLWRWERDGLLVSYKVGARRVLYNLTDLLEIIEKKGKHDKEEECL